MKVNRLLIFILLLALLFAWLVLSPVMFFGSFNKVHEVYSENGDYKVVAYSVIPSTPYSLYQHYINYDVFLVLYDRYGHYIGQSSPFSFSNQWQIFSDDVFFPGNGVKGYEGCFAINGVNDFSEGYIIPVEHKKWWSIVIGYFY